MQPTCLLRWNKFKVILKKSFGESNAYVANVWSKLRRDTQQQVEELRYWVAHLEHLQSIILEFDTINTPREDQLGRTFYNGLRPLIKLSIADVGQDMPWNNLVSAVNITKVLAKIQESTHLDQRYVKEKWPLKMNSNSRNDQADKK